MSAITSKMVIYACGLRKSKHRNYFDIQIRALIARLWETNELDEFTLQMMRVGDSSSYKRSLLKKRLGEATARLLPSTPYRRLNFDGV